MKDWYREYVPGLQILDLTAEWGEQDECAAVIVAEIVAKSQ